MWLGYHGGRSLESFGGADGCGPITYSNWHISNGEPHLSLDDNCVLIGRIDAYWYDAYCTPTHTHFTLCQLHNCYRPQCQ